MYAPHGLLAVRCFLPSALRVSVHDTYFHLPVPLQCFAEFRHFQQAPGVGNDENSVKAGPHPADFMDQFRHINGGSLPDDSAADALPDEPLTGASYPADLFVEVSQFLIGQPDVDSVCSASHGFSFLQGHRGGTPVKRYCGPTIRCLLRLYHFRPNAFCKCVPAAPAALFNR